MKPRTRQLHIKTERRRWADAAHHRVLKQLNEQPESPSCVRVIGFLQCLKRAETLRLELHETEKADSRSRVETNYSEDPFGPEEYDQFHDKEPRQKELRECFVSLERHLERLRWSPAIRSCGGFSYLCDTYTWSSGTVDEWEHWATLLLLRQLKGAGMAGAPIMRFRQCRQCSKWFYALTDHQLSCSKNCRKKFASISPTFKERRARYMRETFRPREKKEQERYKPKQSLRDVRSSWRKK